MKKMMKKWGAALTLAVLAVCAMTLVSCGDDFDPDEVIEGVDPVVVGQYRTAYSEEDESVTATFSLKSNGTFTGEGEVVNNKFGKYTISLSGTYTAEEGYIVFTITKTTEEDEKVPYTRTGTYSSDGKYIVVDDHRYNRI